MKQTYSWKQGTNSASISVISTHDEIKTLWQELEKNSRCTFFHSWPWVGSWLELVMPQAPVYFYGYYQNEKLVAACLLTLCATQRKKGFVRLVQLQVNEYLNTSCNMVIAYNGLLAMPGVEKEAWSAFFKAVEAFNQRWDEISFSSLPPAEYENICASAGPLKTQLEKVFYRWVRPLPAVPSTEALVEGFKKKSRQQLRQTLNAFAELGTVEIKAASSAAEALQFFKAMEKLHTLRWQTEGKGGSYANPLWVSFHQKMIQDYFSEGIIQMLEVHCAATVIGYLYGHVYRQCVYMHQTGFPLMEDNRYRPGYISHVEAMLYNSQQGNTEYDFLPDSEASYKKFFTEPGEPIYWVRLMRRRWVFLWEDSIEALQKLSRRLKKYRAQHSPKK